MAVVLPDADERAVCADPSACEVCWLDPLPSESHAAHVARLKARFRASPPAGKQAPRPRQTRTIRVAPVRMLAPCPGCGHDRVTGLPCGVCRQERRTR